MFWIYLRVNIRILLRIIFFHEEDGKYEVKYYARVEDSFKTPVSRIGKYNNYLIWTKKHVSSYFNSNQANLWLLRVYQLNEPVYLKRSCGMLYANVDREIDLDYENPVIDDDDFEILRNKIINK